MERRNSQIFVIKDTRGKTWTTKRGLELLLGICVVDSKKYFYDLKFYEELKKK